MSAGTPRFVPVARALAGGRLLLVWAILVLVAAFAGICVHTGTVWPWNVVVHEDGVRTLTQTILYVEHATRELPVDLVLGLAIGGSVALACAAPAAEPAARRGTARRMAVLGGLLAIVVAIIVGGTVVEGGLVLLRGNILQYYTRSGEPAMWGSHWRYHMLSRPALMLVSLSAAFLLRAATGLASARPRHGAAAVASAFLIYAVLTVIFAGGWTGLAEPFADPRFLGHQAREVMTHALVTLPAAWGLSLVMTARPRQGPTVRADPRSLRVPPRAVAAGVAGLALGAYAGVASVLAGATGYGQTQDLATLLLPHFFEHTFTYFVVSIEAALVAVLAGRPGDGAPGQPGDGAPGLQPRGCRPV